MRIIHNGGNTGWRWLLATSGILLLSIELSAATNVAAQIQSDSSLGSESSTVKPGVVNGSPSSQIEGGARRGANLFHSFQDLNVADGQRLDFTSPDGVANILSRVTGKNPSNILGTLGVRGGNANLFLINPNGILFGPNARLDVRGSFVGTTANGIGLTNGEIFSATPGDSLPSAVLNVNPNALFFNQLAARGIVNRSTADNRGLTVPQGRSLLLVGGDVRVEGGKLSAPGGRAELGGMAGAGTIGLSIAGNALRLSFPDDLARADILLTDKANVNVQADGKGSIAIYSQNLSLAKESKLQAGTSSGLNSTDAQVGSIDINTPGTVQLTDDSSIANTIASGAIGKSGDINIQTGTLSLSNGGLLNASIRPQGKGTAGNVTIQARNIVSMDGEGVPPEFESSGVRSNVAGDGVGKAGKINLTTGTLTLKNGAALTTNTYGMGDAGTINVNARDAILIDGQGIDQNSTGIYSAVRRNEIMGNAGTISITTGTLALTRGGVVGASSIGYGNAGNVNINARNTVSAVGQAAQLRRRGDFYQSSGIFANVNRPGQGRGGTINLATGSLFIKSLNTG